MNSEPSTPAIVILHELFGLGLLKWRRSERLLAHGRKERYSEFGVRITLHDFWFTNNGFSGLALTLSKSGY